MSELLWITVPGGLIGDGAAVVSVVVVPRLSPTEATDLAAVGMSTWPQTVAAAQPVVVMTGLDGPRSARVVSRGRQEVWDAFFPKGTLVRSWQPAEPGEQITVTRTSELADRLTTSYSSAVAMTDASQAVPDLANWPTADTHRLPTSPNRAPQARVVNDRSRYRDFHQIVAKLREHPRVLRELGLIFDVVIDQVPPVADGEILDGTVHVSWAGSPVTITSPKTQFRLTKSQFTPSGGRLLTNGLVDLRPDGDPAHRTWQLTTFDVDSAAAKYTAAGTTTGVEGLPPLRSGGLSLLRRGRIQEFIERRGVAISNAARSSMATATLTADELLLGYRVDVRVRGEQWHSLMERIPRYSINRAGSDADLDGRLALSGDDEQEEGHIKPHAVTARESSLSSDEVVVRWTGWSLAASRPTFDDHPPGDLTDQPDVAQPEPPLYDFRWQHHLPDGSLLPLRFGVTYELRLRGVDLAGGGPALDDPAESLAPDPIVYRRYEPIPSPVIDPPPGVIEAKPVGTDLDTDRPPYVYHLELLGPGGGLDTLVVRSDRGVTPAAFAAANPYPDNSFRTLRPPPATFQLTEQHGRFDGPSAETFTLVERAMALPGSGIEPLPDPAANGVVLWLKPRGSSGVVHDEFEAWKPAWPDFDAHQLRLRPGPAIGMTFSDGTWTVTLSQGSDEWLEISSFTNSESLFQVKKWLDDAHGEAAVGRHPMITPAHRVRLVHAVRKPLTDPTGTFSVDREAEASTVRLTATVPYFGVHKGSTAQLDVAATWLEWGDADAGVPVGAQQLPSVVVPIEPGSAVPTWTQDFGDTKRRDVTYTVTAVSRYREYFNVTDPKSAFLAEAPLPTLIVPSSARPVPLKVLSVTPAVRWSGDEDLTGKVFERTRSGGRLRVELAHPWHTTGVGEQVAVVVADGSTAPPPRDRVSVIGRDPIWSTQFERGALLGPDELVGDGPNRRLTLPDGVTRVAAVPFDVFLLDGRWYADITFAAAQGTSYRPFVQLALARYQPQSLDGLHLSTPVQTDLIQLLPDRHLSVRRSRAGLTIELRGTGPVGPRSTKVTAVLERLNGPPNATLTAVSAEGIDLGGWQRIGPSVEGDLNTPLAVALPPADESQLRVLVKETEQFAFQAAPSEIAQRITYACHVPLRA